MTVEQFKQWFDGFVDALQLEVGGIDVSDMEDIFSKIKEKLAEVEQHAASTISTPPTKVPENLPYLPPTSPYPPTVPVPHINPSFPGTSPGTSPDIWYTSGTSVDRLSSWPGSSSTANIKSENEK